MAAKKMPGYTFLGDHLVWYDEIKMMAYRCEETGTIFELMSGNVKEPTDVEIGSFEREMSFWTRSVGMFDTMISHECLVKEDQKTFFDLIYASATFMDDEAYGISIRFKKIEIMRIRDLGDMVYGYKGPDYPNPIIMPIFKLNGVFRKRGKKMTAIPGFTGTLMRLHEKHNTDITDCLKNNLK